MPSMNSVQLIGRLTRDPELRYTQNGTAVANMGLAVDNYMKEDHTDFFDIVVWGKQAESCANNLGKGRLIGLVGRLEQRQWEDTEGKKRYKIEVVAENVQFLDWPKDDDQSEQKQSKGNNKGNNRSGSSRNSSGGSRGRGKS